MCIRDSPEDSPFIHGNSPYILVEFYGGLVPIQAPPFKAAAVSLQGQLCQKREHCQAESLPSHFRFYVETVSYTHLDVYKRQLAGGEPGGQGDVGMVGPSVHLDTGLPELPGQGSVQLLQFAGEIHVDKKDPRAEGA